MTDIINSMAVRYKNLMLEGGGPDMAQTLKLGIERITELEKTNERLQGDITDIVNARTLPIVTDPSELIQDGWYWLQGPGNAFIHLCMSVEGEKWLGSMVSAGDYLNAGYVITGPIIEPTLQEPKA